METFNSFRQSSDFTQIPQRRPVPPLPDQSVLRKEAEPFIKRNPSSKHNGQPQVKPLAKYGIFSRLLFTTTISSLLLARSIRNWAVTGPGGLYHLVQSKRASTQLVVQVLANFLGLIHVTILGILINHTTRLRLASTATSLDTICFWHDLCSRNIEWNLPIPLLIPLLGFIVVTLFPSALWAGAITLVSVSVPKEGIISVPSFANANLLHEYGDRRGASVPSLRSTRGFFTYNVGEGLLGSLLSSASLATTVDGSIRQYPKLDNTAFTYLGRSYGIGASIGLLDDEILGNPLATQYRFQEGGYNAQVACIYNSSSNYLIEQVSTSDYAVTGKLPNSNRLEYYDYFGYGPGPLVSIATSSTQTLGRILAIAAGSDYAFLNTTQCSINFQPTLFNVTVGIIGRNITVIPVSTAVEDIDPSGNLSYTTMRQFDYISSEQTGLYTSLVGISFNDSIGDYNMSRAFLGLAPVTEAEATLRGLENSVTAMTDDMLGAYAAAQIMVAKSTSGTVGSIQILTLRFGQNVFIHAIAVVNGLIVCVVVVVGCWTRGWKGLVAFDYMNSGALIMDSFRGGVVVTGGEDKDTDWRLDGSIKAVYEDGKISCVDIAS
jgi:hypothetical protein